MSDSIRPAHADEVRRKIDETLVLGEGATVAHLAHFESISALGAQALLHAVF